MSIQFFQKVSDYSKSTGLLTAQVAGAAGISGQLVSVFLKEGAMKSAAKNVASLGGYGFLAGASIFTGAAILNKLIDKYKEYKKN